MNVTAQFKAIVDRRPLIIYEQFFDRKYGLSLTTANREARREA
ncbi:MAG TPA: hypothetical protein VGK06_11685 [Methanosarcina sp.]|jgi:multimeric flavodoxin WrbA